MNRDSMRSLLVWTSLWAVTAAVGATLLHYARRLSWSELALPAAGLLAMQIALYAGILLARKRRSLQVASALVGLCIWAEITWAGYYAWRWALIPGLTETNLRSFSEIMLIFMIVFALMPQRWMRRMGEIKCAKCGHYHEGRDCSCGCRAGQFQYPSFPAP
jgi:hypothetical protein